MLSLTRLGPGVALAAAISAIAFALGALQAKVWGRVWIEPLVIAILLGALIRSTAALPARLLLGIAFSARTLLEWAIVLIGANMTASAIGKAGGWLIFGIATVVILSLAVSYALGRAFGLNHKLALLIATGNAICGNSAIAAVAPIIGADARDIAAAIAFTAMLGVIVVLTLPLLAVAWSMPPNAYGIFAGMTVYAVPQVLAATAPISSLASQVGTFVKLVRVLMLGPLVVAISLFQRRSDGPRPPLSQMVPWFITGFLVMMMLRTFGYVPEAALPYITLAATWLTLMAMAALGLGCDIRDIAAAGPRVSAVVTLSIIALGLLALGLVAFIAPA